MAEKPAVNLEISPEGKVHFKIEGLSGKECEDLEKALVTALQGEVESRERTAEYYQGTGPLQRLARIFGK